MGSRVVLYSVRDSVPDARMRLTLSSGTCKAETVDPTPPPYVPEARGPIPDWRPPTPEENSFLWSPVPPHAHRGVGLARLLGPELLRLYASRKDIFEREKDEDTLRHPLIGLLLDIIKKAGLHPRHVLSARIGRDEPGRITMTKAVDRDARIGLHFDRWDRLPVDQLEGSSNRVSINLGPGDRYFIFVSRTASGMAEILERSNVRVPRDVRAIGAAFLARFPSHPVARLRLQPGDAYIAPTENILHDGSSAEVRDTNHYLSIRGRFEFSAP